jgi:hypothetical protein
MYKYYVTRHEWMRRSFVYRAQETKAGFKDDPAFGITVDCKSHGTKARQICNMLNRNYKPA